MRDIYMTLHSFLLQRIKFWILDLLQHFGRSIMENGGRNQLRSFFSGLLYDSVLFCWVFFFFAFWCYLCSFLLPKKSVVSRSGEIFYRQIRSLVGLTVGQVGRRNIPHLPSSQITGWPFLWWWKADRFLWINGHLKKVNEWEKQAEKEVVLVLHFLSANVVSFLEVHFCGRDAGEDFGQASQGDFIHKGSCESWRETQFWKCNFVQKVGEKKQRKPELENEKEWRQHRTRRGEKGWLWSY